MASNLSYTKRSRAKRGLPRPCKSCGQDFRPKGNKAKFCSSSCKMARRRLEAKTGCVGLPGTFRKPRVTASGWHIEAGELVFESMPYAAPFSIKERRRFGRGHLHLALDRMADLDLDIGEITPGISARSSARTATA